MKKILTFMIFFCAIVFPAISELTVQDIEKIDAKIKESEKRIKEHTNIQIESIKEHINVQIESIKSLITWLIALLVAIIALIGIPLSVLTIMIGWRSVKDNSQDKKGEDLKPKIVITHTTETETPVH